MKDPSRLRSAAGDGHAQGGKKLLERDRSFVMSSTVFGAVIGYGGMGNYHVAKMLQLRGVKVAGVYDTDPEKLGLAESRGLHAYGSREALLADPKITFVTVATPNDVHKEIVIAALRAGKHVICEKPVAMNSAELDEMIAVSRECGRIFTVHQNRRWDEDFRTIRKICGDGRIGRVFRIESRVHGSRGIPAGWREEKKHGGGMILDWGVHLIDQMLTMMREKGAAPVSVFGTATHITNAECDDGFSAVVKFDNGLDWLIEVGTCTFVPMPRWYALGDSGSAVIDDWACNGKISCIYSWADRNAKPIAAGAGLTMTMAPRKSNTVHNYKIRKVKSNWLEYYRNFIAAVRGKEEIIVKPAEVQQSMKMIEALFRSIAENKVISLRPE